MNNLYEIGTEKNGEKTINFFMSQFNISVQKLIKKKRNQFCES